ncbi:MAG: hypothetical protein M1831_002252 [Alyxoria varia]|nr:MAG: hypothetical protein M1831_002252 [Alyxoria varia]
MPLFRKKSTQTDAPMTIGSPVLHTTTNRTAVQRGGATLIPKPGLPSSRITTTTAPPTLHPVPRRVGHLPESQRHIKKPAASGTGSSAASKLPKPTRSTPSNSPKPTSISKTKAVATFLLTGHKKPFSHLIAETTGQPVWHQRVSAYGESTMDLMQEGFYFRPAGWFGKKFTPRLDTIDEGGVAEAQGEEVQQAVVGGAGKYVVEVKRKRKESYDRLCSNSLESLLLSKGSAPTSAPAAAAAIEDSTVRQLKGPLDSHPVTAADIANMKSFEQSLRQSKIKRTSVCVPGKTTGTPRSPHRHSFSICAPSPTGYNKEIGLYSLSYLASRSAPVLNIIEPDDDIKGENQEEDVADSEDSSQADSTISSVSPFPSPTLKLKPSLEQVHYLRGAGASAQNRRRKNSSWSTLAIVDGSDSTTTASDNSSNSFTSSDSSSQSSDSDSGSSSRSFLLDDEDGDEKAGLPVGALVEDDDDAEGVRASCEYDFENSPPRIEVARIVVPVEGSLGGKEGVGRVVVKA